MKQKMTWTIVLFFALGATHTWAQKNKPPDQANDSRAIAVPLPPSSYFQFIRSASSQDGLIWTKEDGIRLEHTSGPCFIVRDDGTMLLYFADSSRLLEGRTRTIGCALSSDGIDFRTMDCTIAGSPSSTLLAPSVVRLPDGRFRLYYLVSTETQQRDGTDEIHSAVSSDGFRFQEEGVCFTGSSLLAPDIIRKGDSWLMYVHSDNPSGTIVAISANGRDFEANEDPLLVGWNVTAPIPLDNGSYRLYGAGQEPSNVGAVYSFASLDGLNWTLEEGVRLPAFTGARTADPFVVRLGDSYRMYYQEEQKLAQDGFPPEEDLYDDTRLVTLSLEFAQSDFWDQLIAHAEDEQDIAATLVAEGVRYENIGVRLKGNSSLRANSAKKPFNISLDAFVEDQQLWGFKTLNLNNGYMDPTLVREKVAYDVFRRSLHACKMNYVRLFINGNYWGLYGHVQQPNGDFVDEWFRDSDGNRFKSEGDLTWQGADIASYQQRYELKSGDDETAWADLIRMLDVLNNTPADAFEHEIQQVLNVDRALWYIALCNLFANLDSYLGSGHNFYM